MAPKPARLQFQSIRKQTPLPPGWRAEWSAHHKCFFFVAPGGRCTWIDPREGGADVERNTRANASASSEFYVGKGKDVVRGNCDVIEEGFGSLRSTELLVPQGVHQMEGERERRFCCCFKTRKGCCIVVWSVVVALLAGLGVALFFLWPRIPNVVVGKPYFPSNIAPMQFVSGQVVVNMAVDVQVYSPNYADIYVQRIDYSGFLIGSSGDVITSAPASGIAKDLTFKGRGDTKFTLPFSISHSVSNASQVFSILAGTDEVVHLLELRCGGSGGSLDMTYQVVLNIPLISWTGYKPSVTGTSQVPCPVTGSEVASVLGFKIGS